MWTKYAISQGAPVFQEIDVFDIEPSNTRATICGDICDPALLRGRRYQTAIVLQALQYVSSPREALTNLWAAVAPGGMLLLSVPVIAPLGPLSGKSGDLWRFSPAGLGKLVESTLAGVDNIEVSGHGCLPVAAGFLYGIAAEDMPHAYKTSDNRFPVVACAAIRKR